MIMSLLSSPNHPLRSGGLSPRRRANIARGCRYLGALAVLITGIAHIEQYSADGYSMVPTIGTLFLLNFIGAIVLAVGLSAPMPRVAPRSREALRVLMALGGIGLGVLSLAGLFVSETVGLFGWQEHGYRMAIVVAIVAEAAAALFLVTYLAIGVDRQALGGKSR